MLHRKSVLQNEELILGLLKLNGGCKLVYSLKLNGYWKPQGTITDTGSTRGNRRAAYRDFFRNHLLNNQREFSIIKLTNNRR